MDDNANGKPTETPETTDKKTPNADPLYSGTDSATKPTDADNNTGATAQNPPEKVPVVGTLEKVRADIEKVIEAEKKAPVIPIQLTADEKAELNKIADMFNKLPGEDETRPPPPAEVKPTVEPTPEKKPVPDEPTPPAPKPPADIQTPKVEVLPSAKKGLNLWVIVLIIAIIIVIIAAFALYTDNQNKE